MQTGDLFRDSLGPEALGADLIPYLWPTFFAIYPNDRDLPRIVDWQRRVCAGLTRCSFRPAKLLHVSVVECGKPKRRLRPLREALEEAASRFSFPAFEITFDTTWRFGKDGRACVALADAPSQERFDALRIALADALRHVGLFVHRSRQAAHLTLGYVDSLPDERIPIEPFGFRAPAVDLVASETGRSHHAHLERWPLDDGL